MSRIDPIMKNLIGTESADDLAQEILGVLTEGSNVPESGNYYVFVYKPKTPGIAYDEHPLVAVTDVFQWGFRGLNYHWGEMRQYTFPEVVGGLYKVDEMELRDLRTLPFVKIRLNSKKINISWDKVHTQKRLQKILMQQYQVVCLVVML